MICLWFLWSDEFILENLKIQIRNEYRKKWNLWPNMLQDAVAPQTPLRKSASGFRDFVPPPSRMWTPKVFFTWHELIRVLVICITSLHDCMTVICMNRRMNRKKTKRIHADYPAPPPFRHINFRQYTGCCVKLYSIHFRKLKQNFPASIPTKKQNQTKT
jgi:hypothetical protein